VALSRRLNLLGIVVACLGIGTVAQAGAPSPPIVNGAPESGFPTVISLGADILDDRVSLCTGNIITTRIILTAAHCTDFIPTSMLQAGGRAYVGPDIWSAEYELRLEDRFVHPEYVELDNALDELGEFDISVVVLAEDAPMRPMWVRLDDFSDSDLDSEMTSIGFGLDEDDVSGVKRSAVLTLDTLDEHFLISSSVSNPDGATICSGDSGGPQVALVDGEWEQWAVHSWGDGGCRAQSGSQRVDIARDWLFDQIEAVHGTRDLCKANGWAGDGVCDLRCAEAGDIDPDCVDPVALLSVSEATDISKSGCSTATAGGLSTLLGFIGLVGLARRQRSL